MYNFEDLIAVIARLLGEGGCPWDLAQTHESLIPCLIEECYETVDAINQGDFDSLKEELGDVLLQTVFHSELARKSGRFDMSDVVDRITKKMISRHTHIFGADSAKSADEALVTWEANKNAEKGGITDAEAIRRIPASLPAMMRAEKVFKKASKAGLLQLSLTDTIDAADLSLDRLKSAAEDGDIEACEALYADYLLESSKISAFFVANSELSLTNGINAYINKICNP